RPATWRYPEQGRSMAELVAVDLVALDPPLKLRARFAKGAGGGADVAFVGAERHHDFVAPALVGIRQNASSAAWGRRAPSLQRVRQMFALDEAISGENDTGLQTLLQFAHVGGPVVEQERPGRFGGESHLACGILESSSQQGGN